MNYSIEKVTIELILESVYMMAANFGWSEEDLNTQFDNYGSIPYGIITCRENGVLIGTVWLYKKVGALGKKEYNILGVGGVCVHKESRGKGIAKRMLEIALERQENREFDFAMLTTDLESVSGLYKKIGFKVLPEGYTYETKVTKKIKDKKIKIKFYYLLFYPYFG